MTKDEILKKYEDNNEYHFHKVDREWILQAMQEYADQQLRLYSVMQSIEELQLLEDIKNCEKNIKAGKEAIENAKKHLYQEEQFLIMYKNRLEKIRSVK